MRTLLAICFSLTISTVANSEIVATNMPDSAFLFSEFSIGFGNLPEYTNSAAGQEFIATNGGTLSTITASVALEGGGEPVR